MNTLTTTEQNELEQCEQVIKRGMGAFIEVGTALSRIRDLRLYRNEFKTFEGYCKTRWNLGQRYVDYTIAATQVVENLGTMVPKLPANERQTRPLAELSPDLQREAWQRAIDTAPQGKITASHVQATVDEILKRPVSYHISDDTYEWYTPAEYIEAARAVMGGIDLDPASSDEAQSVIKAKTHYTKEDDGLSKKWLGRVWLNPPYNMPLVEQFIDKAIGGYERGNIKSAIVLTNNSTDTGWFHKLVEYPVCLTSGRIAFWNGGKTLATRQGQALFYLGTQGAKFAKVFRPFGAVLKRYDD